jgi:hypothetical protein
MASYDKVLCVLLKVSAIPHEMSASSKILVRNLTERWRNYCFNDYTGKPSHLAVVFDSE